MDDYPDLNADGAWTRLVKAEREAAQLRAEILNRFDRTELIGAALRSPSNWDQSSAIEYLRRFPDEVSAHLEAIFRLACTQRWASRALEPLRAAAARKPVIMDEFRAIAASAITDAQTDLDYQEISNLLTNINADDLLETLRLQALASADPDVHGFGRYLSGQDHAWPHG